MEDKKKRGGKFMWNKETDIKFISGVGNDNPFTVPEGYFEKLPSSVMSTIDNLGKKPKRNNRTYMYYLRPVISAAACVALVVLVFWLPQRYSNQTSDSESSYVDVVVSEMLYRGDWLVNSLVNSSESEQSSDSIDSQTIETLLIASMSDYELYGY